MAEYFQLKESDCKNCHKCIRYCPVKAISFSKNQAHVIPEECILCGECFVNCPQNAKDIRDDIPKAKQLLMNGEKVYASVAPSFVSAFPEASFNSFKEALKKLGFFGAEETALGAASVKRRYEEIIREGSQKVIISTCCHSINSLVQKHYAEAVPYLAKVVSPMLAHGMSIKRENPGSKVVFIGPCISKKAEAEEYPGIIDCVLTFEDIHSWLDRQHIHIANEKQVSANTGKTRLFPTTGGILESMDKSGAADYSFIAVDGMENCITALEDVINGNISNCFIEMSACTGSCVGGPAIGKRKLLSVRNRIAVLKNAGSNDFDVPQPSADSLKRVFKSAPLRRIKVSPAAISEVLEKMGKTLPEHELNCGSCGYETCREKAYAVLTDKAEINMCLPYLMARAESFSENIIGNTPNGIIVLNREMIVQQINAAACRIMNIREEKTILGRNVVCVLDPSVFIQAVAQNRNIYEKQLYLAEYKKYINMTVVLDGNYDIIIAFMRDVTEECNERRSKDEFSQKAIEITDKVIEKQMRTVQEIASLLGETTAETKVALERLKETLQK